MRIKRIECDQFAGLQDKELELEKGLNIVIGDNESGKSTMVDLIYHLLFKDVKLDRRSDAGFIDKYFPMNVGGSQGNVIDGVLVFETPDGTYKLKKEWDNSGGTCRLTLPDGTSIKGNSEINEILKGELNHRAGVYNEIVFSSQKRDQIAVESIMKALGKKTDSLAETRDDLTSTLTQAALETGGVSIDKLEKTLKKNMDDLSGHWDFMADAPEGGPKRATWKNQWKQGVGAIAKAYYEVDEVRSKQEDAEKAEREVETEKAVIVELQAKKKEVETQRLSFQKIRGELNQRSLLEDTIKDRDRIISERSGAITRWPEIIDGIVKAGKLQTKQKQARDHELFCKAEQTQQDYISKNAEFEKMKEVDSSDLKNLRDLSSKKRKEEGKLAGMNLAARIKKLGPAEITVKTASSGETLDYADGEVLITEAVDINIPGVMDMQLTPKGVDVETVKANLKAFEKEIKDIHEKYGVGSFEELQELSESFDTVKRDADILKNKLDMILGERTWEDVKTANDDVPEDIESEEEIKRQIADLCGTKSVDAFLGGLESTLADYEGRYESVDKLKESIEKLNKEKESSEKKLKSMDKIPDEFRGIDDPDRYDAELQRKIEGYENQIEEHSGRANEAARKLGDKSAEEYSDELQEKEDALAAKKAEYGHWRNIHKVFCEMKEQTGGNPVEDIEARFREYLEAVTDGSLQLNSMDEKLSVQLASGTHALTYDTLSEGTRDTISLAFRLAMLEHLYPDGDGLAVFDDPFTDMDPKRVDQACKLIQKFAENNQVIFVTCDGKYQDYMSGNVISMSRDRD